MDNAKYFVINKTAGNGVNYTTVTETTSASVAENQKIIVAYTMVGGVKHAQYVYICTTIGEDINNPTTPASMTLDRNAANGEFTAHVNLGSLTGSVVVKLTVSNGVNVSSPVTMTYVSGTWFDYPANPTIAGSGMYTVTATAYIGNNVIATATYNVVQ